MEKYSEEEILASYQGRCISEKEELKEGYCGSASIEIHRKQLSEPDSWVHSSMSMWIERVKPKPTIEQLQAEIDNLRIRNSSLEKAVEDLRTTSITVCPVCEIYGITGEQEKCNYCRIIELEGLITRAVKSLEWMITDMKNRFDEERSHFGQEVNGGYSEELTKAIELNEELRKV